MQFIRSIYDLVCKLLRYAARHWRYLPNVIKNWESFEFLLPLFAIATIPRCENLRRGWISSSNGSKDMKEPRIVELQNAENNKPTSVERFSSISCSCLISGLHEKSWDNPNMRSRMSVYLVKMEWSQQYTDGRSHHRSTLVQVSMDEAICEPQTFHRQCEKVSTSQWRFLNASRQYESDHIDRETHFWP